MKHHKIHKNTSLPAPVKAAVTTVVTVLLLLVTVYAVSLAVVRSADAGFRERLCGTMTERGFLLTDWYFTSEEIRFATAYEAPEEASGTVSAPPDALSDFPDGDGYTVAVYELQKDSLTLREGPGEIPESGVAIGLSEYPGMILREDLLSYTGEADYEKYCFCGVGSDGILHIGVSTPVKAVNAGWLWGISCDRVLVSGGLPCADLRGGYGVRAAIGQRADGTVFLAVVTAESGRLYPRGMTYDTLAFCMYRNGAVNAAALPVAGKLAADGKVLAKAGGKAGYVLTAACSGD